MELKERIRDYLKGKVGSEAPMRRVLGSSLAAQWE